MLGSFAGEEESVQKAAMGGPCEIRACKFYSKGDLSAARAICMEFLPLQFPSPEFILNSENVQCDSQSSGKHQASTHSCITGNTVQQQPEGRDTQGRVWEGLGERLSGLFSSQNPDVLTIL